MASRPSTPRDPAQLRHGQSPLRQVENASYLCDPEEVLNGGSSQEGTASQLATPSQQVASRASPPDRPLRAVASDPGKQPKKSREIISPLASKSSLVKRGDKTPAPPASCHLVNLQQTSQELAGRPKTRQLGLYQLPPSSSTLGQKSSSESSPGSPVLGLKSTQSDDLIYSSSNPLGIFNMGIEKSSSEASGSKATAGAAASFVPAATAPEFRPMSSRGEAPTPAPAGPRAATPLAYRPKGAQAPEMATSGSTGGGQGRYAGRALMPGANFLYQPQLEYETPPVERKAPPGGGGAAAGAKEKPPSHAGPSSQGSSGAANVSHTSSKTWVSEEEQLRMDYNRMRERVQHIGAAGSPCLPRTMFDYAGFEAQIRIVNANKMMKKIRTMRDDLASKEAAQKHGNTTRETRMLAKAFAQPGDGRSVALGMQSSFNAVRAPPPPPEQVDWPSHAELKANGDDRQRAGGFGRYLPPPRKNTIDARMLGEVPGAARVVPATADTPYSFKQVVGDRWDWVSAAEKARLKAEPTEEIHPDEVHDGLRDLLEEINDFADEEDLPGGRRWVK